MAVCLSSAGGRGVRSRSRWLEKDQVGDKTETQNTGSLCSLKDEVTLVLSFISRKHRF